MTTKPLNRASYPIGHACELLNVNASQLEELLSAGVLSHAADGVEICAKSMEAYRNPSESEWLHGEKPSLDGYDRCLSPAEVKMLHDLGPGWRLHFGGECPVDGETVVQVRFRDGDTSTHCAAYSFAFLHCGVPWDIVAYRVVPADQPAEPEKQPQHTPGPWGVEQTESTNWIGPLRVDGKVDRIVAQIDRRCLRPDVLAEADADARLIAQAPSMESIIEECLKQRDDAEAAADELASLILGEPVDWAFHNEAWQRAVEQLKDAKSEPDCKLPTTSPHEGCHVVQADPQPFEWWERRLHEGTKPVYCCGRTTDGRLLWQTHANSAAMRLARSDVIRRLPDCDSFDYEIPPEETSAEKLAKLIADDLFTEGVESQKVSRLVMELNGKSLGTGWSEAAVTRRIEKAIASYLQEREEGHG